MCTALDIKVFITINFLICIYVGVLLSISAELLHIRRNPNLNQTYFGDTWSILEAYLKNTWSTLEAYLKHTGSIVEAYMKHNWSIPKAKLKHTWSIHEAYLTLLNPPWHYWEKCTDVRTVWHLHYLSCCRS